MHHPVAAELCAKVIQGRRRRHGVGASSRRAIVPPRISALPPRRPQDESAGRHSSAVDADFAASLAGPDARPRASWF
jgi:hypothetical protein